MGEFVDGTTVAVSEINEKPTAEEELTAIFQRSADVVEDVEAWIKGHAGDEEDPNKLSATVDAMLVHHAEKLIAESSQHDDENESEIDSTVTTILVRDLEARKLQKTTEFSPLSALSKNADALPYLQRAASHLDELLSATEDADYSFVQALDDARQRENAEAERGDEQMVRVHEVIDAVWEEYGEQEEGEPLPKRELVCDSGHLEGQRVGIGIEEMVPGEPKTVITLKLVGTEQGRAEPFMGANREALGFSEEESSLAMGEPQNGDPEKRLTCKMRKYEKNGVVFYVAGARPVIEYGPDEDDEYFQRNKNQVLRSAIGLVKIELPDDVEQEDVDETILSFFRDGLGVDDPFSNVPEDSERAYRQARLAWFDVGDGAHDEESEAVAEGLVRQEVFPGYSTYINPGFHKEILGDDYEHVRAFHVLHTGDGRSVFRALRSGIMSTSERFSRGIYRSGLSSGADMISGGSDSVFTRIGSRTEIGGERGDPGKFGDSTRLIFRPELFDRTDWYTYASDRYGSTAEYDFHDRNTPQEIINGALYDDSSPNNEQMFRVGISPEYIESVVCPDDQERMDIIHFLRRNGMRHFMGRPIEELVLTLEDYSLTPEELIAKRGSEYEAARKGEVHRAIKRASVMAGSERCESFDELLDLANYDVRIEKRLVNSMAAGEGKQQFLELFVGYMADTFNDVVLENWNTADNLAELPDREIINYASSVLGLRIADIPKINAEIIERKSEAAVQEKLKKLRAGECSYTDYVETVYRLYQGEPRFTEMMNLVTGSSEEDKQAMASAVTEFYTRRQSGIQYFRKLKSWNYDEAEMAYVTDELGLSVSELKEEAEKAKAERDANRIEEIKTDLAQDGVAYSRYIHEIQEITGGNEQRQVEISADIANSSESARKILKEYYLKHLSKHPGELRYYALCILHDSPDDMGWDKFFTDVLGIDVVELDKNNRKEQ